MKEFIEFGALIKEFIQFGALIKEFIEFGALIKEVIDATSGLEDLWPRATSGSTRLQGVFIAVRVAHRRRFSTVKGVGRRLSRRGGGFRASTVVLNLHALIESRLACFCATCAVVASIQIPTPRRSSRLPPKPTRF